jgi:hypothetical protein
MVGPRGSSHTPPETVVAIPVESLARATGLENEDSGHYRLSQNKTDLGLLFGEELAFIGAHGNANEIQ